MKRSLTLKRETQSLLTDDDLSGVVGGIEAPVTVNLKCITQFTQNTTCLNCE